jgi:cytochrome c
VRIASAGVLGALALVGCSGSHNDGPSCVANLNTSCSPLYAPPTYAMIFEHTLRPTCAQGIGTCHTSDAAKGGLVFEDAGAAYALLLGTQGGKKRVLPGDPSCSLIVEKLESTDPKFQMPPGNPLLPSERCDFVQWIAQGAAP